MSCRHSLIGSPDRCSQCLGATPRRVEITDAGVTIDGVPASKHDEEAVRRKHYMRGGRARAARLARKDDHPR